jgi:hypothetical protein
MAPTRAEGKHLPSWVKFVRTDTAPARCSSTTVHVCPCSLPHSEPRVTHRAPRGHDALIGMYGTCTRTSAESGTLVSTHARELSFLYLNQGFGQHHPDFIQDH